MGSNVAAVAKSGVLHSVRVVQCPALTSAAARIMAESSPMYAWIDDTVPKKFRKDAAWRLARFRMPSVIKHLRVVLRTKEHLQDDDIQAELAALACQPAAIDYANIYDQPLTLGKFEVVAIYTLLPPEPLAKKEPVRSVTRRWADSLLCVLHRRPWQMAMQLLRRLAVSVSMSHYGLTSLIKMNAWINSLNIAAGLCKLTDVYDRSMHNLQTMCVAADQQRQGLGSSVMQLAKLEVQKQQGSGMLGLCQSDATRVFYEKQGFASRDVFTHPPSDLTYPAIRKHFLVAWDARRVDQDIGEVAEI